MTSTIGTYCAPILVQLEVDRMLLEKPIFIVKIVKVNGKGAKRAHLWVLMSNEDGIDGILFLNTR